MFCTLCGVYGVGELCGDCEQKISAEEMETMKIYVSPYSGKKVLLVSLFKYHDVVRDLVSPS